MALRTLRCAIEDLGNTYGWGACVVVCAFSAKAHRIRVSRHGPAEA